MDDAVRRYKHRRALRMRSRFDSEDDGRWVTTGGTVWIMQL